MLNVHPLFQNVLIPYAPEARWFPVEVRIGDRYEVIDCYAIDKHEAFHMAIKTLSKNDPELYCSGVTLRIL